MKTQMKWEDITKNELIKCYVKENLSDSDIAKKYNVTVSKVRYKRNKHKISQAFILFEKFKFKNQELFIGLNKNAKERLFGDIDLFSKMITSYVFRSNDYLEDLHAKDKAISDSDMKQLNKYMVDRLSELLIMADKNDWMKMELVLYAKTRGISEWDKCNPALDEIEVLSYLKYAPSHVAKKISMQLYSAFENQI